MPSIDLIQTIQIERTPRVAQVEGMFDVPVEKKSVFSLSANLPIEERPWQIGLICGPSGSGKTSVARRMFRDHLVNGFDWPENKSVVDAFSKEYSIKEICAALSSVGFSSPPGWIKPFRVLSNGEQFRVTLARALVENRDLLVFDEFTSVVDRTVARIGSAAVAKHIRRNKTRFIAVSCHNDIEEWLQPDWKFDTADNLFSWRCVQQRPAIELEIERCKKDVWKMFCRHHYLSARLNFSSLCFLGRICGNHAAFTAVQSFPHPHKPGWREHRTVVLPDFQGVGVGNSMSEFIASLFICKGKPYRSTTSHPAMIMHRAKSPHWRMIASPELSVPHNGKRFSFTSMRNQARRRVASFEYVGPKREAEAKAAGVVT